MESVSTVLGWTVHPLVNCIVMFCIGFIVLFPAEAAEYQKRVPVLVRALFLIALGRQVFFVTQIFGSDLSQSGATQIFLNCLPLVYIVVFCGLLMIQVLRVANQVSCRLVFLSSLVLTPWVANVSLVLIQQHFH